jgi:hypothetical protein
MGSVAALEVSIGVKSSEKQSAGRFSETLVT